MAAREGFLFEETLTGFKWMGTRAAELRDQGYTVNRYPLHARTTPTLTHTRTQARHAYGSV